jgi:hypothetical protein
MVFLSLKADESSKRVFLIVRTSYMVLAAVSGMAFLVLTGYQSGPAANAQGNRTTSGTNATCSGSGCHGANNTNTTIALNLLEGTSPVTDGQYKPNTLYSISLTGTNIVNLPAGYGFQLTAVTSSNSQAGTFTASGLVHTSTANTGGLTVVEHNASVPATAGSGTTPAFTWLSPAAGSGTVTFHAIMNAVNGNNFSDAGDHASTATFTVTDKSLSVDDLTSSSFFLVYPNPATEFVNIFCREFYGNHAARIIVRDLMGKEVHSAIIQNDPINISTENWVKGVYFVCIVHSQGSAVSTLIVR